MGVGGVVYDKDAVYIDLGGSHSHKKPQANKNESSPDDEGAQEYVKNIISSEVTLDEKLERSELKLFSSSALISSQDHKQQGKAEENTGRRKVKFQDSKEDVCLDDDAEKEDDEEEEE